MSDTESMPVGEFAFPGPLRDRLVAAILDGSKTATSSLLIEYGDEELPQPEGRQVVIDSAGQPVCVIETTGVKVARLAEVDDEFARDEGEGFAGHQEWRIGHEEFWQAKRCAVSWAIRYSPSTTTRWSCLSASSSCARFSVRAPRAYTTYGVSGSIRTRDQALHVMGATNSGSV